jgi:hypothetical protein
MSDYIDENGEPIFTGINFPNFNGPFSEREPKKDLTGEWIDYSRKAAAPVTDPGLHIILRRTKHTKKGVLRNPMLFQIAPINDFGWDVTYAHNDYETINKGQYSRPAGRQLRTIQISTLAMDWSAPWAVVPKSRNEHWYWDDDFYGSAGGPWRVAKRLDHLCSQGTPMWLVVKNPKYYKKPDVKMRVTLRAAQLREKAGEPDARYFDLSFTEWRNPAEVKTKKYGKKLDDKHDLPATVQIGKDGRAQEQYVDHQRTVKSKAKASKKHPVRHVIGGDGKPATLRMLSKHYYGTPKKWNLIKQRNGKRLNGIQGDDSLLEMYSTRELALLRAGKLAKKRIVIPKADWRPMVAGFHDGYVGRIAEEGLR